MNGETLKSIEYIKSIIEKKCTFVCDRGYDANIYYEYFLKEECNADFRGWLQPVYIICIAMSIAFFPIAIVLAVIAYLFILLLDAFEYIFITSRKKESSLNKEDTSSKDVDLKEFKIKSFKKL